MSERREWPNVMREIRDQAAEEAFLGVCNLAPVITSTVQLSEPDRFRREARALHSLHNICRLMAEAGAPHKI